MRRALPLAATLGAVSLIALSTGCESTSRRASPENATPQTASHPEPPPGASEARALLGDAYYLSACAWCAGMLGAKGDTLDRVMQGRDVRFCSAPCAEAFERDPAEGFRRADDAMIADQVPRYPLATSIVSGRALPDRPADVIVGNRLFRLADRAEHAALARDPARYLRELDEAVLDAQRPAYPMPDKCPVQGDILAADTPIDFVVANRMVRVCCMRCARVVRSRPSQYLSMIDYANAHRPEPE